MKPADASGCGFPRYWLAMSDAYAFSIVQSVLAFAVDLRRDLAERAQVVARPHAVEIATILLTAADEAWGQARAEALVSQIVGEDALSPEKAGTVYMLVREALARMPATIWASGRIGARAELIEALRVKGIALHETVAPKNKTEQEREEGWIRAAAASGTKEKDSKAT